MSQSAPPTTPALDPNALRIVLFGLPAAGKSSLLGALIQSATLQVQDLGGKLEDRSRGLGELGRQLYEETPRRTPEEVVPYPIRYQPHARPDGKPEEALEAILLDCDGRVANEILQQRQSLGEESREGTLAHEILEADAVILAVDASTPARQMEADFAEFARLLDTIQAGRGARVEVAGLPIFLVLTKCDLLAERGDTPGAWMERIEQRKREVAERFREFLVERKPATTGAFAEEGENEAIPFGKIDLHVWATAIKRPVLMGSPPRPREPYAVAPLFRQCLSEAAAYRARHERSQKHLTRLVVASGLLVAVMLALTVTLFVVNANTRVSMLQARVEDFRFLDRGGPADRLKGGPDQLRDKLTRLEEIRDDPSFPRLPQASRGFITERIEELTGYIPYLEKMVNLPPLSSEQTEVGLERLIERIREQMAPPVAEWGETVAGQLRQERLEGAEALRKAVQAVRNWFLDASDRAGRLWTFADYPSPMPVEWVEWTSRVEELIDPKRQVPFRESDAVPGVPGGVLTFATVFRFDRVLEARSGWETDRVRLNRLLDILSAVGLAPATKSRPAVLAISRGMPLPRCKALVGELKTAYPEYAKTFVNDNLPETIQGRLRPTLRRHYELLLEPAREEVLRQLRQAGKGSEETPARWDAVRGWLKQPEELTSWRELARVLLRLGDPAAVDPVQSLGTFLAQGQFSLEIRSIVVEIPETRGLRPREEGRLVVQHPAGMREPALSFEVSGEATRNPARRVVSHTYRLVEGQRLTYRPGDRLWAELALRGGKEKLVWSRSRSQVYQFERLLESPRLQAATATSLDEGRLLDDIKLILRPEEGVPAVPDLLPTVTLGP